MSTQNHCRVDQFKTNEETEGNKTERSTYLIRTVNCSRSKNLLTIEVMKLILLLIRRITVIMIKIVIKYRSRSTIMVIIFWDLFMFDKTFLSPQVKRIVIIRNKHCIYKLPSELLNDLRFRMLENYEISGKSQNFIA